MQRSHWVGIGVATAVAGSLAVMWLAMPETGGPAPAVAVVEEPAPPPARARERRRTASAPAPSASAEPTVRVRRRPSSERDDAAQQRARTTARQREARAGREAKLPDEEKAQARREVREDVAAEIRARVDDYAVEAGWDAETHAEVKAIFEETQDRISRVLGRVDRGELAWNDVRRELRQYRLDSAAEVEGLLGEDGFRDFAETLDFQRFLGDEPIRGRL